MKQNKKIKFLKVFFIFFAFLMVFIFINAACKINVSKDSGVASIQHEQERTNNINQTSEQTKKENANVSTKESAVTETSLIGNGSKKTNNEIGDIIMKIESSAFKNNENIPSKYTCDGENINPPLKISEIPQNTVSLALIVEDPDAPGGTWIHWTVFNINPDTKQITENSVPEGAIEGVTDFGKPGYGGPCPPSGVHRYFFKLYALDLILKLNSSASADDIKKAMEGHILGSAELVGLYSRK